MTPEQQSLVAAKLYTRITGCIDTAAYNSNEARQMDKRDALVARIAELEKELTERKNELRVTLAWLGEHPEKGN